MKTNWKRISKRGLALLLSLAIVITLTPNLGLASDEVQKDEPAQTEQVQAEQDLTAPDVQEEAVSGGSQEAAAEEADAAPADEDQAGQVEEQANGVAAETDAAVDEPEETGSPEKVEPEEGKEEEKAEEAYPAVAFVKNADGMTVRIKAPEGALPEGAGVKVEAVPHENVFDLVNEIYGEEANVTKAVDITFYDKDGTKIEPKKTVSVSFDSAAFNGLEEAEVIHISDYGDVETVAGSSVSGSKASFRSDEFSVYAVVDVNETDPEENAVATYEFYVEDELVQTQYLKTGDTPTDPGTSVVNADDANTVFKGWFIGDDPVDFDSAVTVDETTTVEVKAKIEHTYYVTFWGEADDEGNRGIVAVKSVTVEGSESGTVSIDDVTVTPKADTSAFKGWSESKEGTETISGDSVEVSKRMDLYAVVVDAYWLHFYENVGEDSDSDATYTGPVFIAETDVRSSKKPADPTRKGYEFGGWYLDEECTEAFDWTATGLEEDTDLYAKWEPGEADFTVIIWKQKITDAKDAADADKTYDFESSEVKTGQTGETIDLTQFDEYEDLEFTGFHYSRTEADPEKVKADGSTVVNIYYDRNLLTINFIDGTHTEYEPATGNQGTQYGLIDGEYIALTRNGNSWTYQVQHEYTGTTYRTVNNNNGTQYGFVDGQMVQLTRAGNGTLFNPYYWTYNGRRFNGTRYATPANGASGFGVVNGAVVGIRNQDGKWVYTTTETYTGTRYRTVQEPTVTEYTGLYGQTLAQNGYTWPGERAWYQNPNSGGTRLTFLDAFKFEGLSGTSENNTVLTQYGANQSGNNYVRFYKQNIDGSWPTSSGQNDSPTDRIRSSGNATFTITEKYEGFKAVQYAHGGGWTNGGAGTSTSVNNLQIRFERQKFTLTLMSESEEFDTVTGIPYEDTLSQHKPASEPTKAHYNFVGWYEDPAGQVEFDWSQTMPAANKVIYAKFEPKQYHVSLDPNGGEFQNAQVGEFNVPLDTILDKTSLFQNVVREGHELIGWFDTETGDAYGFGKIEDDVSLIAKWRYPGQVKIEYDVSEHSESTVEDQHKYATDSSVVLAAPPEDIQEGYAFVGWSVGGKKYYTNNTFEITEDIIEDYDEGTKTGTVKIKAIYQKLGEGALTPTTITYDPNGGTGTAVTIDEGKHGDLLINEPMKALAVDDEKLGFTREGYEFTGWNTMKDGSGLDIAAGIEIAADLEDLPNNTKINTLYAQWVKVYTVTFDTDGGTPATIEDQTVKEGEKATKPEDPTKENSNFLGWFEVVDGTMSNTAFDFETKITKDTALKAKWEGTAQEVSVRINGNRVEKQYNGAYQDGEPYTLTWFVDGEEVSAAPEGVSFKNTAGADYPNGKNAKEYYATIRGEIVINDTSKYKDGGVTYDEDFDGVTCLVITPAPLVVKLTGNKETVTYSGREESLMGLTFEVEGLKGDDTKDIIEISGHAEAAAKGTDVGTYPMNMEEKKDQFRAILKNDNHNYTTEIEIKEDGWLKIEPAEITIVIEGTEKDYDYDGSAKIAEGYTATSESALFDEDKLSYEGEIASTGTDAGEYPYDLAEDGFSYDDDNVNVTYQITGGNLVINPVSVTVKTGSDEKKYDGTALTNEEASITGLVEKDEGKVTVTATGSQTEVGSSDNTYEIDWGEANQKNYKVTEELGTLTVTAAEPKTAEITYDLNGGEYNGSTDDIVETHEIGETITIHEAPTRDGYEFLFWKGSEYQPGDSYTVEGDHTFVAQWKKTDTSDDDADDDPDNDTGNDTGKDKPGQDKSGKSPKTGDDFSIMMMLIAMAVSGGALVFGIVRRRREED